MSLLRDFSIEEIIEHVASWPTSNETLEEHDVYDLIDVWIALARQLRARDRRDGFHVVERDEVI